MPASRSLLLAILAAIASPAAGLDLRVGTGTGCTHATLQAALDAIEGVGGDHNIRINAGSYAVPDGMVYQPTVAQGFVRLEGGYASCTAPTPSGSPTTDAGRSIFDGGGGSGLPRSVLELQINGLVGSFQMRRIALQGGDALASAARFSSGGGLAIYGRASVLVGSGVSIRNNVANNGGGVALVGSRINVNEPLERVDFFIDEGAEIRNNNAAGSGGGIYCGGATTVLGDPPAELRHGSVVHRDGAITGNQAARGAALFCLGSYAGGGWQPRPNAGAVALIANNIATAASEAPGVVVATLDLIVDPVDGVRTLGAIGPTNSGFVLLQNNEGTGFGALRLLNWGLRGGASPAPAERPRFRLQNILFVGNRVQPQASLFASTSALDSLAYIDLTLAPSSPGMRCGALPPLGPCVLFENNGPIGAFTGDPRVPLITTTSGNISVEQARIRDNAGRRALTVAAADGFIALRSSVIDGNAIAGTDTVLFESSELSSLPGDTFLSHVTVTGNSHDRYFRIEGTSRAAMQGTVLHNAGAPRPLRFGSAPNANLTLRWCNYLTTLSDAAFTGATQVPDSFGPLVTVTGALTFDAAFNPPFALIDRCQPPSTPAASAPFATPFDFYGNAFGFPVAPANPNRLADIGAVEFRPEVLLSDGFEAP